MHEIVFFKFGNPQNGKIMGSVPRLKHMLAQMYSKYKCETKINLRNGITKILVSSSAFSDNVTEFASRRCSSMLIRLSDILCMLSSDEKNGCHRS